MIILKKIPELINAETKKVADQLTAPGGALEDVKNEIKKALDDIDNTFDGFEDAISDVYNDINEVSHLFNSFELKVGLSNYNNLMI